jgi:hypothetical protein
LGVVLPLPLLLLLRLHLPLLPLLWLSLGVEQIRWSTLASRAAAPPRAPWRLKSTGLLLRLAARGRTPQWMTADVMARAQPRCS